MNRSGVRALTSLVAAAAIAGAVLVTIVLPAEYGTDPLGTGELLGVDVLAPRPDTIVIAQQTPLHSDTVSFELRPWESVEFKFEVPSGGVLVYDWQADAPVVFEFHGEPASRAGDGFAETWEKGERATGRGVATLPFAGRHGWFFENRSFDTVEIRLEAAGFYTKTFEYRDGFVTEAEPGQ